MNGDRVREVRELLEMTQTDFAFLVGSHQVTVCRWERGVYEVPLREMTMIELIARAPEAVRAAARRRIATHGVLHVLGELLTGTIVERGE